jgi:hypothetical protein
MHAHQFLINPGERVGDKRRSIIFKRLANQEGQEIDKFYMRELGKELANC